MKALVVYESIYGNTQRIAEAIGKGLTEGYEVSATEVGKADYGLLAGIDLLVVGGPTHIWGMSRPMSREGAAKEMAGKQPVSSGIGVREWLEKLPRADGVAAAAFDTAVPRPLRGLMPSGSAASGIASRLKGRGFRLVAEPQQFIVRDKDGPLAEGELERAEEWGHSLASLPKAV